MGEEVFEEIKLSSHAVASKSITIVSGVLQKTHGDEKRQHRENTDTKLRCSA